MQNGKKGSTQENGQMILELKALKEQVKKQTALLAEKDAKIKELEAQIKSSQQVLDQAVTAALQS